MSLQDPTSKMSKSDPNANGYISILDDRDTIIRKFKKAVTDSEGEIAYREGKAGINNLINIYCAVTGKTPEETVAEFSGKGYGEFKLAVGEIVADELTPIRERYEDLRKNKDYLETVFKNGAQRAYRLSDRTLSKVKRKVGFVDRPF